MGDFYGTPMNRQSAATRLKRKKVKNIVSLRKYTNSDKPLSEHLKFFRPNFIRTAARTEQHTAFRRKRVKDKTMNMHNAKGNTFKVMDTRTEKKIKKVRVWHSPRIERD